MVRFQRRATLDSDVSAAPVIAEIAPRGGLSACAPDVLNLATCGAAEPHPAEDVIAIGDDGGDCDARGVVAGGEVVLVGVGADHRKAGFHVLQFTRRGFDGVGTPAGVVESVFLMLLLGHHLRRRDKAESHEAARGVVVPGVFEYGDLPSSVHARGFGRGVENGAAAFQPAEIAWPGACLHAELGLAAETTGLLCRCETWGAGLE